MDESNWLEYSWSNTWGTDLNEGSYNNEALQWIRENYGYQPVTIEMVQEGDKYVAVLPKKPKRRDNRTNGTGYSLPKGFKGVKGAGTASIDQLKKDAESRPSKEVRLKDQEAVTVRFLHDPADKKNPWKRFDEHYVREGKAGSYVPCIGDGCPLDDDPDARSSRRWLANVLDVGTGEVRLLKMTKAMVDSLIIKYERSGKGDRDPSLMRRNYTIIRIGDDQTTKYEIENEDPGPVEVNGRKVNISKLKQIDIDEELTERVRRFYGGATGSKANSRDLDDEDDEDELDDELEDEEDELDEEEDEEDEEDADEDDSEKPRKRSKRAVAEDDDDDDEDEDEEDDEEEDEPVKPKSLKKRKLAKRK